MGVDTLPSLFDYAVRTHNRADAFRYKRDGAYVSVSHADVFDAVDEASLGLTSLGLFKGDRVVILSENRLEWVIADLAVLSAGCIDVPIYASLPARQIEYILRDCEARAIFLSGPEQYAKIEPLLTSLPNLVHVVTFDPLEAGDSITLAQLREKGRTNTGRPPYRERIATIGKYDWASIIYTSGTTGDPKGVILNHWNFVSNVIAASHCIDIGPSDSCLSFLPLCHVLERTGGYYTMLYRGASIAYAESTDTVTKNLTEVSPTIMISVPRLYEKMYSRILDSVTAGPVIKRSLFFWAVNVGRRYVRELLERRVRPMSRVTYKLADRLVFRTLRARTGGKLRLFVSGGAPLARDIAEFFYAAGLPVLEGYGLTETSPLVSVNTFKHFKFGTVGRPIENVDVRIAEDGEIVTRGPNIMLGYYKKPDLTDRVLKDGWFYTGDIGYLDEEGFLTITDRKKDLIVTAGGKNVAPQPIENLLKSNKYIDQAVVIGDKRKFISAIIVANMDNVRAFAAVVGIPGKDDAELIGEPRVIQKIHDEIEEMSVNLAGFERVKKFILLPRDFTIEGNELTPTLKVKRAAIEKKFAAEIDALYRE